MGIRWYKVHGGRLSFREYWKMADDPFTFLIAAGAKLFGGLPMNFSIPYLDQLDIVELDDLPGGPRRTIKRGVAAFEDAGFDFQFVHELPVLERNRFAAAAILLAPNGRSFATVNFAEVKDMSQMAYNCVCWFGEGRFGTATTQKEQMKPDPKHLTVRYPGASPEELADRHKELVRGWEEDREVIRTIRPDALPDVVLSGERGHVEFHAERGVYVPMTKDEVRKLRGDDEDD
jgi:hypothetical protein